MRAASRLAGAVEAERGSGQPLPAAVRAGLEHRFGHDLSAVRLHTGTRADGLSRALGAEAFTSGDDVFLRSGSTDPRLLAHEVAHVVLRDTPSHRWATGVSDPHDAAEVAAARAAVRPEAIAGMQRVAGNAAVRGLPIFRAAAAVAGGPAGPDKCLDLLRDIAFWTLEVTQRIGEAKADVETLFRDHRRLRDAGPHGSWEGHVQRFERERKALRFSLDWWDIDDECRNRPLSAEQQEILDRGRAAAEATYPERPVRMEQAEPGLRERVTATLVELRIPLAVALTLTGLILVALADPEPLSKVGLIIGTAAAVAFFAILHRGDDRPPDLRA